MKTLKTIILAVSLIIVLCLQVCGAEEITAWVSLTEGKVQVKSTGRSEWINIDRDYALKSGDSIRTDRKSSCVIKWDSGNVTRLFENTVLHFKSLIAEKNGTTMTGLKMDTGRIVVHAKPLAKDASYFIVRVPTAMVGVKGTNFFVEVDKSGSAKFGVLGGEIFVASKGSEVKLANEAMVDVDSSGNIGEPYNVPKGDKIEMYRALMVIKKV